MACGKAFEVVLANHHSKTCSHECSDEFQWRETLSVMGEKYYPRKKDEKASVDAR